MGARRNIRRRTSGRNQRGFHLIEALVALVVGAAVTFSLTTLLSQTMRQSSSTQSELSVNQMMFGLLDFIKKQDYETLKTLEGTTVPLLVTRRTAGDLGQAPRQDPALLDLVSQTWSQEAQKNNIDIDDNADANIKFETGPINGSIRIVLAVSWKSGQISTTRTVVASTIVTEKGAQEWRQ